MNETEEDGIRLVVQGWIDETPAEHLITRLLLREHLNEITLASQTGMRKGNQYALRWEFDTNFPLRLIHLPRTKSDRPHTIPMTNGVYDALLDQQEIQRELASLRGDDGQRSRMQLDGRVSTSLWLRSSSRRFLMPRASLPVKPQVSAVCLASPLRSALRCSVLAPDSSHARKAVPICTPAAPRAKAATMPRASPMPPAATTGSLTASTTCGTSAMVPVRESSDGCRKEPRWPPASKPEATITSTPACSRAIASSTVVAVQSERLSCGGTHPTLVWRGCQK
jgi:hypothetical protein